MKRTSFAIVISLLGTALPPMELSSQEPLRFADARIPRVSVAGAFDARNNGRSEPEMYLGLATLEWTTRLTGLALRVDGFYAARDRLTRFEPTCGPTCDPLPGTNNISFLSSKVTAAGALVGVTYDVRRSGAFRPYILGSVGAVRSNDRFTTGVTSTTLPCVNPCTIIPLGAPSHQRSERPLSAAAQVGLGLVYSWRWFSVFGETRYMAVDYANTRGLNGAVPVSLGVRF